MAGAGRVVIAGVGTRWGMDLARALALRGDVREVIGIDATRPEADLGGIEFVEADIRSPVISRILPALEPDIVVHCGILWYPDRERPSRALHDINVIGSLQLLAACEKSRTLRTLVVRGSAAIYGSAPDAPCFYTEEMARQFPLRTRFQRDIGELEGYFDSFARRRPDVTCSMLRFQIELGSGLDDPFTRYLGLPVVPVRLGFDPRLQLLHPIDGRDALVAAVINPVRGPVNVAPDGTISLSRLLRLAGRPSIGLPSLVAGPVGKRLGRQLAAADMYRDAELLLRYGRGCDNRRLREEVGYEPAFDTEGAVREFAGKTGRVPRQLAGPHPGSPVRVRG